ncbi:hypothetical protein NYQ43_09075 [Xanthomonas translucens pv. translucens]|uniref:hypothetical protein n=1 Tax=Xanthomonas campestris pv. translucens TaxID=343 RepID=UPI0019D6E042|nr:hypothetical protein [Xanthomonas translucens]MCT8285845.1 hypothetical protein [Xanthomonas translucens pv. translucens]MCT8303503.1 hypothetical protein [Xanthomonas translucens pv. translucens]QSQ46078.1 hypothetical protein ISN34_04055 [Xanthomonas translucens pv. translucens]
MKIHLPGVLLFLFLAGCNPMNAVPGKTDADGDPIYRKNPHPTQAYRITMTIENAPGPFGFVDAAALYQMTNHKQCTPMEPIEGVWSKSKEDGIPMRFQKINETTYVATIYADGMVDSDYYGKSVCHFELSGVAITLRATGKHEETRFQPGLFKEEIYSAVPSVTYFWSGRYPKSEMDNYPDTGHSDPTRFKEELRNQLFKVTVVSSKETP